MRRIIFFIFVLVMAMGSTSQAQSVAQARAYIRQERYIDAAKELRPLADGGDAEAQYWAAKLFLEGKLNTAKAEEQGVKYATLAADQGNERAIILLVDHYVNDKPKAYSTVLKYTKSYPELKKGKLGYWLAVCYMQGLGCIKDEDMAWFTIEGNEMEKDFIESFPNEYETYKKRYPHKFKEKEERDRVYDVPEEAARFPGDVYAWMSRQIKYPKICIEQGIQGRVTVQFVIDKDGSIIEEKVIRSPDSHLSEEALRVVRAMPKWLPARQGNKLVRSRYNLPIMFSLPKETK